LAATGFKAAESLEVFRPEVLRAERTAWLARELGLAVAYEASPEGTLKVVVEEPEVEHGEETPAWNRKVRADGMAVNLYLCRKYGSGIDVAPQTSEEEQAALWWSLWAQNELEPKVFSLDPQVTKALTFIENQLGRKKWLIAKRFTVADINIAGALACMPALPAHQGSVLENFPKTCAWLERCLSRPCSWRSHSKATPSPAVMLSKALGKADPEVTSVSKL